jgi:hypothetical protein
VSQILGFESGDHSRTRLSMNLAPQDRAGSDPHRFDVEMHALGARLDEDE